MADLYKNIKYSIIFCMISHPNLKRNVPQTKKQRLFRLFFMLVYQYKISPYICGVLLIIQMLQTMYFAIHPSCCKIWNIKLIVIVQKILGSINGSYVWQMCNTMILMIISSIMLIILLIACLIIVYQIYHPQSRLTTNYHQIRIKYMQYLFTIVRSVLMIPIISICTIICKNTLMHTTQVQSLNIGIIVCLAIVYSIIMYLILQLFVDSSPFGKLPWCGPINSNQKYKSLIKTIIAVISAILPNNNTTCGQNNQFIHILFCILIILSFFYMLYLQFSQPNLVYNVTRYIYQHSLITLLAIYIMSFIHQIISPNQNISILFAFIFCVCCNFGWAIIKDYRQRYIFFNVYKSLTDKDQILSFNYLFCQYIRDYPEKPICLIKMIGALNDHIAGCKKLDQVCKCKIWKNKLKQFTENQDKTQIMEEKEIWFQFIKNNLTINAEKMNHQPQFHLMLSSIQKAIFGNIFVSYSNLQKCAYKKLNITTQFLIYHRKRILQKAMLEEDVKKNEKKQVDVNKYLQMSNLIQQFKSKILKSSLTHLQFWKKLQTNKNKKKSYIMKQGSKLLTTAKQCEQLYKNMTQKYPNNLQCIVIFSNYSKYILNNHQLILKNRTLYNLIKKKLCRSIKISSEQQKQKYSQNSTTGSIIISGQKQNVGIIKYCSSKISNILKYAPYELVGQNINTLMPTFIGNMHNQVLFKYLQKQEPANDFIQRYVPAWDKNNFMIISRIMTKPLPCLLNGLQLIGVVQKVKQIHIRHGKEQPKYMLYRCDTGKIQALSQSFYTQYGYRLMKLNQESQIFQELSLSTLFNNVQDSDITNKQDGLECELRLKKNGKKSIKIKMYVRIQLVYFGVKIKLVQIFSHSQGNYSTLMFHNAMTVNPTQALLQQKSDTQINNNIPNSLQNASPGPSQPHTSQTLKDQQLKQLKQKMPLKYRIFQVGLLIWLIIMMVVWVVQFYYNIHSIQIMRNFIEHNKYAYNSLIYLINIGYYARQMHISAVYPLMLPNYQAYVHNISLYTDQLQQSQFWLLNKQSQNELNININRTSTQLVSSWQMSQLSKIYQTSNTLNINIFDYVTSASSFKSASKHDLNFTFKLIQSNAYAKNNSYFRNIFKLRYSALYQLIPTKQLYINTLTQAYTHKLQQQYKYNHVLLAVSCIIITIFLIFLLRLLYILIQAIFTITTLFNWLTHNQINKQISRCENFLQHFFIHSYQVILVLKNNQILRGESFQDNYKFNNANAFNTHLMKTGTYNGAYDQTCKDEIQQNEYNNNMGGYNNMGQSDEIDLVKISNKNIQLKQQRIKQSQLLQQTALLKQQQYQNNNTYNTYNTSNNIQKQEQQQQQQQQCILLNNFITFIPVLLGLIIILSNSIGIYFYRYGNNIQMIQQLNNQNIIYENIENMDKLKYYGIQQIIDDSKFNNYKLLSQQFKIINNRIYELQRIFNQFSQNNIDVHNNNNNNNNSNNSDVMDVKYEIQRYIYNKNIKGLCTGQYKQTISWNYNNYNNKQCIGIDNKVLDHGMRASIVAYIQNIVNITKQTQTLSQSQPNTTNTTNTTNISDILSSISYNNIQKLQKYIKSAMYTGLDIHKQNINTNLNIQQKIYIFWFTIMIIALILIAVFINIKSKQSLVNKILGTYQIITLIPRRIFQRNSNLRIQYRKNVQYLLS